ncbi:hypothetical protein B0O80DRAFT_529864 [Mortierella sp. GBAus27b]|nr:hypothetical protein BGX31_008068 [Mortierella sp. GBA43]KAI8353115.1 hypothetical protein B0O80DRAFT_529864 [Mortierella sp. GBAus27b]
MTTAATKHRSDAPNGGPAAKRSRHSKTNKSAKKNQQTEDDPVDGEIKEEQDDDANTKSDQPTDSEQLGASSPKSKRRDRSPKVKTEEEEKEKKEPNDEVKTEEKDVKPEVQNGDAPRVIEKGHAFFFYRPKMDVDKPSSANDVQKLYMLLSPEEAAGRPATEDEVGKQDASSKPSFDDKPYHRLLIIPQKSLPSPGQGRKSRIWSFVDEASADLDKIESRLERYTYSTKTRGERTQESARLIAEAHYDIVIHHGHSHFVYQLEVPQQPTEVQEEFNILKEGQFVMQVKNPEIQTPATDRGRARYASLGTSAAKLPKHLQEKFRGVRQEWVRYATLDTPEFLDIPHVELGLFAVNKDVRVEFADLLEEIDSEIEEEETKAEREESPEDHLYKELNLDEDKIPCAIDEFK